MGVGREMSSTTGEENAEPPPMRPIHETREALRLPETGGRRIEAGGLVAPARIIGMLGDRQEFDMGKAHVDRIGDELIRQLVPAQEIAIVVAPPRSGMDLIDGNG